MRIAFVRVIGYVAWDQAGGLAKNYGILEVPARKQIAASILHKRAVGCINNYPASLDIDFGDHVFGGALRGKQQEAARFDARAPRKIKKGVRGAATHCQELAIIQCVFRIAWRNLQGRSSLKPRRTVEHPAENGLRFLLRGSGLRDDRVGETFQVLTDGVFP